MKISQNICCQKCNREIGDEIDKPFAEEFSLFSTILGTTTGRNKNSRTQKVVLEHNGEKYNLEHGGILKLKQGQPSIYNDPDDDSLKIRIRASSLDNALSIAEGILKKYGQTLDNCSSLEIKEKNFYLPQQHDGISGEIDFYTSDKFRAVAKMLLTYLATMINPERLRSGSFDEVISFIKGDKKNFLAFYPCSYIPLPETPKLSNLNHRMFIFTSQERNLVVGVLELFGSIKYTIELTSSWDGPSFSKVYFVDPVNQLDGEKQLDLVDFTAYDSYKQMPVDTLEKDYLNLSKEISKEHINQVRQREVNNILTRNKDRIEKEIEAKGIITEQQKMELLRQLATECYTSFYRIDSEEIIDFQELF